MNRFSQINFGDTGSPINLELYHDTVGTLQQKYDQGYIAIASTVEKYNSLPILSVRDKEFINGKINELTQQLNSYGNVNLADPKVVADLTLKAQSLAKDPEVMRRVKNNQNASKVMDGWEKIRANPKLMAEYYHPENEKRDMKIIQDYMDGKTDTISISAPTLYTNVIKRANELAKQIEPRIEFRHENGYTINGKYRSTEDIINGISQTLFQDPSVVNQLAIEADGIFERKSISQIREELLSNGRNREAAIDIAINGYQEALGQTSDNKLKDQYREKIKEYEELKKKTNQETLQLEESLLLMDENSLKEKYRQHYSNQIIRSVANNNEIFQEVAKADLYGLADKKHQHSLERLILDHAGRKELNDARIEAARQLKMLELTASASSIGAKLNPDGTYSFGGVTVESPSPINNDSNPYSTLNQEIEGSNEIIKSNVDALAMAFMEDNFPGDKNEYYKIREQWDKYMSSKDKSLTKELTEEQLNIFNQAKKLLSKKSDPDLLQYITSDESLKKYTPYINAITEESYRKQLLETEIENTTKLAYEKYKRDYPNSKMTKEEFERFAKLPDDAVSEEGIQYGNYAGSSQIGNLNRGKQYINEELKRSNLTDFYRVQIIADADKDWNKGGVYNGAVQKFIELYGIYTPGTNQQASVGGYIATNPTHNGKNYNLPDEYKVKTVDPTRGIIGVELKYKGDSEPVIAEVRVPLTEFRRITGYTPVEGNDAIMKAMKRRNIIAVTEPDGTPKIWHTQGLIPDFSGNIQHSFIRTDNDKWKVRILGPGIDATFPEEVNSWNAGTALIVEKILRLKAEIERDNPTLSKQEIDKKTLELFYQLPR